MNNIKNQIAEIEHFIYNKEPSSWIRTIEMANYKCEIKDIEARTQVLVKEALQLFNQ